MITPLLNQTFQVLRNYPTTVNGIPSDNYKSLAEVKGRISNPSYNERLTYQNRGMILTGIIYLDVYDYDEQRDLVVDGDNVRYDIKGLTATRNEKGVIAFLRIPVTENQTLAAVESGGSSES